MTECDHEDYEAVHGDAAGYRRCKDCGSVFDYWAIMSGSDAGE